MSWLQWPPLDDLGGVLARECGGTACICGASLRALCRVTRSAWVTVIWQAVEGERSVASHPKTVRCCEGTFMQSNGGFAISHVLRWLRRVELGYPPLFGRFRRVLEVEIFGRSLSSRNFTVGVQLVLNPTMA